MSPRLVACIGLTVTILLWAGNYIAASLMTNNIPPISGNFWRWFTAALILLPLTGRTLLQHREDILQAWKYILLQAVLSISIFNALIYLSAHSAAVISLNMIQTFSPVATFFLAWLVLGRVPSRHQLAGLAVAFVGILILLSQGNPNTLLSMEFGVGNLWMILAVFCWALYTVLLIRNPLQDLPPIAFLAVLVVAGLILLLPFYLLEVIWQGGFDLTPQNTGVILYMGIFPSIIAFYFWNKGVAVVGPQVAATFFYIMPIFVAILSYLFLGDRLQPYQVAGQVLIFAGFYLSMFLDRKARRARP